MNIRNAARKTIAYAKRNGAKAAFFAAMERLRDNADDSKYTYVPLSQEVLREQKQEYKLLAEAGNCVRFSIVVPLFNTPENYLKDMIESVIAQTYGNWELVLADASFAESEVAKEYAAKDPRIEYYHLGANNGISHNTNRGLEKAHGDYIGLLDHDDVLTPDALYEVSRVIRKSMKQNKLSRYQACPIRLIYSDEDKFEDNKGTRSYYEHHAKPGFNMDYLLANNYICHFTVIRSDIIKRLKLRHDYDGAQDYDLFLRTCIEAALSMDMASDQIAHIDKVLYHWRCHRGSTASNPASKTYAYEAGQKTLSAVLNANGVKCEVVQLPHLGFYRVNYQPDVFSSRKDIGCVGGRLISKKDKVAGGIYKKDGTALYKGLPIGFSGGLQHRAVVQQDCYAVDLRCMAVRPEFELLYEELTGISYVDTFNQDPVDDRFAALSDDDIVELSIKFCAEMKKRGLRVMWDPGVTKRV